MRDAKVPIGLAAALRDRGISLRAVEELAGLAPNSLDGAGLRVAVPRYLALWRAIRTASGDPGIGLALAQAVRFDFTEPLFLAIVSAPTMGAALDVLATYKRILTPEVLDLSRADGEIRLSYEWPEEPPDVLIDVELAFVVEMCRRAIGQPDLAPKRIHLRRPRIEDRAGHARYFQCPLATGAAANAVAFDAALAAAPLWTGNAELGAALATYLEANAAPPSPIARVRAAIARGLGGRRPTLASVGKELAMSSRSLQRVLKENRTSFRALLDGVRKERALAYLRGSKLTDAEVAFLLGFEDQSSFYRAFRAWNGRPPSAFRDDASNN
jgi:AraC-like DNA-binding protein